MKQTLELVRWLGLFATIALTAPFILICCAEWSGNDFEDSFLELLLVSAPVSVAVLSAGIGCLLLRFWFISRETKHVGSMLIAYIIALLTNILTLWGAPIVWALLRGEYHSYNNRLIMIPAFYLNFELPPFFFPCFALFGIMGALLGFKLTRLPAGGATDFG